MKKLLYWLLLVIPVIARGQPAETHHYAIDVAGIRVGTMTAIRQPRPDNRTTYTLVSDVKVHLLVYTINIYYKVVNEFTGKKLMLSTVDAHTNRGNYASKTEWITDHYDITANQYKYQRQAVERNNIVFPISSLYFYESVGHNRVFAEYFGDYFTLSQPSPGTYRALLDDHEDEYLYENGRLVKVIKHNTSKSFIIRLLD